MITVRDRTEVISMIFRCCLWLLTASWLSGVQANMLWAVEDEQGNQSWLLGTMHSEAAELLEIPPELRTVLESADTLALELVPDGIMLAELNQAMHLDGSERLGDRLRPALYRQVVDLLEREYGLSENGIARMRPWAVAMTLSLPPPQTGLFMDLSLSFRASAMGLEVVGLETLDEQLDFLQGMDTDMQIRLIESAVNDFEVMPEVFEELIEAYLADDLDRVRRVSNRQLADLGPEVVDYFQQAGLIERNHRMLERAEPWLADGGLIIAVGALHLPGTGGLIALLRENGYTVSPVPMTR